MPGAYGDDGVIGARGLPGDPGQPGATGRPGLPGLKGQFLKRLTVDDIKNLTNCQTV